LENNSTNFLDSTNDTSDGTFREISSCFKNFSLKGLSIGEALLDFLQVILLDDTLHKAGNNLDNAINSEVNWSGIHSSINTLWWSDGSNKGSTNLITEVEVIGRLPVSDGSVDVSHDYIVVFKEVGGDGLSKGNGVLEDSCKCFKLGNISLDWLALVQIFGKFSDDSANLLDGSKIVAETTLLEIMDNSLDFSLESFSILDALFKFSQIISLDDSIHKTSNDLDNRLNVEANLVTSHLAWSSNFDEGLTNNITELVELGLIKVSHGSAHIWHDVVVVLEEISSNGLSELSGVLKDLCPVLKLGNIILDVFTALKVSGELSDDLSKNGDSSHDSAHWSLLEVSDYLLDLSG
jgi:hypothetical protein